MEMIPNEIHLTFIRQKKIPWFRIWCAVNATYS